jgi:U3 small nucleolar RNA-associated protein 14
MPPRIARSSVQSSAPAKAKGRSTGRNPQKAQKRALNAFAIAQFDNPEENKVRRNRLGELDPSFHRKRNRDDDDDDDEDDDDEEGAEPKRRRRRGDDSYDEGSDSEGNTWTMGHVEDDDDDEIDSDEAFGESDEERFEGYTFRGSAKSKGKGKSKARKTADADSDDIDMDDDSDDADDDSDDLGDDAIDLATALDQYDEDEAEEKRLAAKKKKSTSAFDNSDDSDSESDADDEQDRQAQLNDLISSLAANEPRQKQRVEAHEFAAPDEFGVSRKVDLLGLKSANDDEKKRALKLLRDDKSKRTDMARKLDAPLPKRQQDKLDRAAANAKTEETLDRWTDTIKQNRRAEHLMFPLQHADAGKSMGEDRLLPTTTATPANDLEATIQSILQQSGLSNGKDDEEQIQKWEVLQTNKLPIDEVMKRRAALRMERELLFREEVRAKRVKKIKSKAYRRVHRKERERLLQRERDQLKADGVDISEDEREHNDRRRAEERMGAKHREGKWAKGIKASGRAAWDEDALAGVTEMAKRNEELRRRMEGKAVRDSDDEGSDVPSDENESEDEDEDVSDNELLQRQLGQLENPFSTKTSKIGQMAFMQKAEAAKRAQNNEEIERLRRELAGEDSEDEIGENATRVGRRKYGPGNNVVPAIQSTRNELEEPEEPESDADVPTTLSNGAKSKPEKAKNPFTTGRKTQTQTQTLSKTRAESPADADTPNPFLVKAKKSKKDSKPDEELLPLADDDAPDDTADNTPQQAPSNPSTTVDTFLQQRVTAPDDDGWATVVGGADSEDEAFSDDDDLDLTSQNRNRALTQSAFAGDDEAAHFETEKSATAADEASKTTTSVLPGWGSWAGDGMTRAERKRNQGWKTTTTVQGIDASKRKDAKLARVIINEKRVKPTTKYMAAQLPFPFESREQYERSLRVPKGKEWVSKKTHQDATKPRVIVKQGVIAPMRKPLV